MSSVCRYFEECILREFEDNPYLCDSRGNVRYEIWDCGKPTGRQHEETCDMYEPMPDVKALLALANEMDEWALTCDHYDRQVSPLDVTKYARRIRKALGVKS